MIIKKRQLLLATLIIALAAAVFVNWYYTRPEVETAGAGKGETTTKQDAEQALAAYRGLVAEVQEQEKELLAKLPDTFRAFAARPTRAPESMSDKLYHEYTIAFPADDAPNELYYIERELEKSRVEMFLAQPRIETIEELRAEAGL